MKHSEYLDLYRRLSAPKDIEYLAENHSYDRELLLVIYTQRVVRDTTKRFYRVKDNAKRMLWMWQRGRSIVEIARKFEFPPVLTALMILEQQKIPRKRFWRYLSDLSSVEDRRLRRELNAACKADLVYSPQGTEMQYARGRWGEAKLQAWLNERGIQYRTEKSLRSEYDKTPDTLLKTPIEWNSSKIYWIESKATFGDPYEIRRHARKQLRPYTEIFGDGMVVYWFGYVDDVEIQVPEGVTIVDNKFFEDRDILPVSRFRPSSTKGSLRQPEELPI